MLFFLDLVYLCRKLLRAEGNLIGRVTLALAAVPNNSSFGRERDATNVVASASNKQQYFWINHNKNLQPVKAFVVVF
ncbi:unnamed protein product [Orchesella dallaii]|uniref:Secreted protein n=1 Tax=Orchesella dallaii TaxID=48710 RepID=A0ABP1Q0W1_9HEXA